MAGNAAAVEASTNQLDRVKLLQQLQQRGGFSEAEAAMIEGGAINTDLALAFLIAGTAQQSPQAPLSFWNPYSQDGLMPDGTAPDDGAEQYCLPSPGIPFPYHPPIEDEDDKTIGQQISGILVKIVDGLFGNSNGKIDTPAEKKVRDALLELLKEQTEDTEDTETVDAKRRPHKVEEAQQPEAEEETGASGTGGVSVEVTVIVNGKEQKAKPAEIAEKKDEEPISEDDKTIVYDA